jgi:S-adenosylmethionine hydrolase
VTRITLLTDFGSRDGFVAAVKGVLATLAPRAVVDDVAHDLPAGDVLAAARALARYWRRYPEGTVHVVVVDPGVGTERAALACAAAGRFLVGPDNGVLTPALSPAWGGGDAQCVSLAAEGFGSPVSPTFHGRDLFAPAAAALATGRALASLGTPHPHPVELAPARALRTAEGSEGEIVAIDRFGNATTSLPGAWADGCVLEAGGLRLRVRRTYGDVASGEPVAVVDSEGFVEVAVRDGSAADRLGLVVGTPVRLARG